MWNQEQQDVLVFGARLEADAEALGVVRSGALRAAHQVAAVPAHLRCSVATASARNWL